MLRIGVDIGGTFTDLVAYDGRTGETLFFKAQTTPSAPDVGCLDAVRNSISSDRSADAEYFLHGTTVGLNSLLERRGAKVGLLLTKGMRDVLEIRRGDRAEVYNILWKATPHLVPRSLCLTVAGRVFADGTVHEPLSDDDVRAALEVFLSEGVETVAVAFMNAYANPQHELRAEQILRDQGFAGGISLSHRISGEYREYERTTTTVIDAYVRDRMVGYLTTLEKGLNGIGLDATCLITRCGGGAMTFAEAKDRSFETILSGPVAGAEGAGELSVSCGLGNLITADVGGTSFDTALVVDGRPTLKYEGEIIGLPLQTSFVDVRTIGSGGGSIAYIDQGGLMQVGPESAGAEPGPACYGKGGTRPTTTDACLYLGWLGRGELASGLVLDRAKAEAALAQVATPLGQDLPTAALGILSIAAAKMANAIREITVEQGIDPREFALLAYGGAGPLMGVAMANELSIRHIIVPHYAGNFSAWGMLGADMTLTRGQTRIMPLDEASLEEANTILADLFAKLEASAGKHATGETVERRAALEMRYLGQEHALQVPVNYGNGRLADAPEAIGAAFRSAYDSIFGITLDEPVEISAVRATYVRPLPPRQIRKRTPDDHAATTESTPHRMYSLKTSEMVDGEIVERDALQVGTRKQGPAIVVEPTATTYVDVDYTYHVDEHDLLHLERTGPGDS